ncbi:hypothetical protein E4U59_007706 [Claviceps monticola]|nr:hypothetical protein E4U59_007706 [Claviceps monticola]
MTVTDPIPEEVEVSSSPAIDNCSIQRATLDIRAIAYEYSTYTIHGAMTSIELNTPPGVPKEDRILSVANHPGAKVDLDHSSPPCTNYTVSRNYHRGADGLILVELHMAALWPPGGSGFRQRLARNSYRPSGRNFSWE